MADESVVIKEGSNLAAALAKDVEQSLAVSDTIATADVATTQTDAITTDTTTQQNGNAATATTQSATPEEIINDFQIPADETAATETNQSQQQQPKETQFSIDDYIQKADRKELLKKLGLDDFVIELNDHVERGGKAEDYINARAINWESVSDADILKGELRAKFPDASNAQIDRLFNKKYNQTDISEEEDKEDGLLLIKADARDIRNQKIAAQKNFKLPEPKQVQQQPQDQKQQERNQKIIETFNNSEVTKNLFASKRVAVQMGENIMPIKYNIEPKALIDAVFDTSKYGVTKSGEPDVQLAYELALFKMNPLQFKKDIFNAGKASGTQGMVAEGQNAQKQTTPVVPMTESGDLKEKFATQAKTGTLAGKI